MAFAAWIFAIGVQAGCDPFLCFAAGVAVGVILGSAIGAVVVYGGLSS